MHIHIEREQHTGGSPPPPPGKAGCRIALVVHPSTDFYTDSHSQGFGHRFTALLLALDVAAHIGHAEVLLNTTYWSCDADCMHSAYDGWAWSLLPFARASRKGLWQAGLRRYPKTPHLRNVAHNPSCGKWYEVRPGARRGCSQAYQFCFDDWPGGLSRGTTVLHTLLRQPRPQSSSVQKASHHTVEVVWHLRGGDFARYFPQLPELASEAVLQLKRTLEAAFLRRVVRHVVLGQNYSELHKLYPRLSGLFTSKPPSAASDDAHRAELMHMKNAEVLVSTASSFSLAAAALAPLGQQLHLIMPPKELWKPPLMTATALRGSRLQQTYFISHNGVAVDGFGDVFPEHKGKLEKMVRALDSGALIDADTAASGGLAQSNPLLRTH